MSGINKNTIKCGWAQADITPKGKMQLRGQFYQRIAEKTRDPLHAVAFCMEQNGKSTIFLSLDLVSVDRETVETLCERISKKIPGIRKNDIVVNATHTHTGPYTSSSDKGNTWGWGPLYKLKVPEGCLSPEEYMEQTFYPKIEKACEEAFIKKRESELAFVLGQAAIGYPRRLVYKDNTAKMYGKSDVNDFMDVESASDPGIELMYVFKEDELSGVVVNVACPSQVLEHKYYYSADYWGDLRKLMDEEFGKNVFILSQCAPAGDQSPRDLIRRSRMAGNMSPSENSKEIAKRLFREIKYCYKDAKNKKAGEFLLTHSTLSVDLPIRTVTKEQYMKAKVELESILKKYENISEISEEDKKDATTPWGMIQRYEIQDKEPFYNALIHIIRIGDAVFVTNPFELFIRYGLQIKARSEAIQTFTIQLSGGSGGYLPTDKAIEGGHYSTRISDNRVGPKGGRIMVEKTIEAISKIMEKAK